MECTNKFMRAESVNDWYNGKDKVPRSTYYLYYTFLYNFDVFTYSLYYTFLKKTSRCPRNGVQHKQRTITPGIFYIIYIPEEE